MSSARTAAQALAVLWRSGISATVPASGAGLQGARICIAGRGDTERARAIVYETDPDALEAALA